MIHADERKEECFICGAKFKTKLGLFKHKQTHSDARFNCKFCSHTFKDKYERDYHERIKHLGQIVHKKVFHEQFQCSECDSSYKTNNVSIKLS